MLVVCSCLLYLELTTSFRIPKFGYLGQDCHNRHDERSTRAKKKEADDARPVRFPERDVAHVKTFSRAIRGPTLFLRNAEKGKDCVSRTVVHAVDAFGAGSNPATHSQLCDYSVRHCYPGYLRPGLEGGELSGPCYSLRDAVFGATSSRLDLRVLDDTKDFGGLGWLDL